MRTSALLLVLAVLAIPAAASDTPQTGPARQSTIDDGPHGLIEAADRSGAAQSVPVESAVIVEAEEAEAVPAAEGVEA